MEMQQQMEKEEVQMAEPATTTTTSLLQEESEKMDSSDNNSSSSSPKKDDGDHQSPATKTTEQACVKVGDHIILCVNEEKYTFAEVLPSGRVKVGKKNFPLKTLIGAKYGSLWEAPKESKVLIQVHKKPQIQELADVETEDVQITTDNRNLLDNNTSQKLTDKEINEMREQGVGGRAIIKTLIENSATFQSKTEFSKVKYLKKKQKKHIHVAEILEPCLVNIATAYFRRQPASIIGLRMDSLARILTLANVHAHSNVLVVEQCKGIVTGAVAERVAGFGKVVSLHLNDKPNISGVRFFNFPEPIQQSIIHVPVSSLKDLYSSPQQQDQSDAIQGMSLPELRHLFFERRFDSLIVVIKSDPSSICKALMPFLKYGQPFVFFSPYLQVLADLNDELLKSGEALALQLSETWMREYQVLPARTRPNMSMNGASGFLLNGIKVYKDCFEDHNSPTTTGSSSSNSTTKSPAKKKQRV